MTPAVLRALLEGNAENFKAASTPGGIEAQEKQGQTDLVNAAILYLPKQLAKYGAVADSEYRAHGIDILGDYDDIFYLVKLPDKWKLQPTEHSMWSILVDDAGNERADIFFKAAFYDRRAHITFRNDEPGNTCQQ